MKNVLSLELETYKNHKDGLIAASEGKYVLIKGEQIIGVYNDEAEATKKGLDEFGYNCPFLAKKITKLEPVLHIKGLNVPCLIYEEDTPTAG